MTISKKCLLFLFLFAFSVSANNHLGEDTPVTANTYLHKQCTQALMNERTYQEVEECSVQEPEPSLEAIYGFYESFLRKENLTHPSLVTPPMNSLSFELWKNGFFSVSDIHVEISKEDKMLYKSPLKEFKTFDYDKEERWVFFFHGMGGPGHYKTLYPKVRETFKGYVLHLDYGQHLHITNYPFALYYLSDLVRKLHVNLWDRLSPNPKKTVFIGHSFGCHVAGVLGQEVFPELLIALDPAGPVFDQFPISQLNIYSARRVIHIETSHIWGTNHPKGHTQITVANPSQVYDECHNSEGWKMMCNHQKSNELLAISLTKKIDLTDGTRHTGMYVNLSPEHFPLGKYNTQQHVDSSCNPFTPTFIQD